MSIAKDTDGNTHLSIIDKRWKTIRQKVRVHSIDKWLDPQWGPYGVTSQVGTTDEVEEFFAYSTDVTVKDRTGAPLKNIGLKITSSSPTQIIVNNRTYIINKDKAADVQTDTLGMLNIIQPAETLGAAALQIEVPEHQLNTPLALRQWDANVLPKLKTMTTAAALCNERVNGAYLLPDEYRNNPKKAEELAAHLTSCVNLLEDPGRAIAAGRGVAQAQYHAGFGAVPPGSAARLSAINFSADSSPAEINFPAAEAPHLPHNESLHTSTSERPWDSSLKDFLIATAEEGIKFLQMKFHHDDKFIKLLVKSVIAGVEVVAEFIIKELNDLLDTVAAIFSTAGVVLETAQQWLGYIFDWEDILRTKNALVHAMDQVLIFSERSVQQIKDMTKKQFANWQANINTGFDSLEEKIKGGLGSVFDPQASQTTPQMSEAVSNNFMYRSLIDNMDNGTSEPPPVVDNINKNSLENVFDTMGQGASDITNKVQEHVGKINTSDKIYEIALSKLFKFLKQVASGVLTGVETVITTLMDLLQGALRGINDLLSAEWNIPFVSAFYKSKTGSNLSAKDLIALMVAIPATAAWKVIHSKAIFKDDEELEKFKRGYTWENIKKFSLDANNSNHQNQRVRTARAAGAIPDEAAWSAFTKKWQPIFSGISAMAGGFAILLSTFNALAESFTARLVAVVGAVCSLICLLSGTLGLNKDMIWTFTNWFVALTWFWIDCQAILMFGVGIVSAINEQVRSGAILSFYFGIHLLALAAIARYNGEVPSDRDFVLSLCLPLATTFELFNFAPLKTALQPAPLVADGIIFMVGSITGATSFVLGGSYFADADAS